MTARLVLKPGREASLARRHPWIFSGAVDRVEGRVEAGDTVEVVSAAGEPLARAAFSPVSQIRARVWTFDPAEAVDEAFFTRRLTAAVEARRALGRLDGERPATRLVHAESDGLPGLIADRYDGYTVAQFLTTGAERHRETLARALQQVLPGQGLFERSDSDAREREGLPPRAGPLLGEEPPEQIAIAEPAGAFLVEVRRGHKTGWYLDQRENRAAAMRHARGREVLNAFSYTGGFAVAALRGGAARVTNVDTSADALALARRHVEHNGLDPAQAEFEEADVFHQLRRYRDARRQFDLIVLDPPKFAEAQSQVGGAARGYKDINLLAFKLLRPGGLLFTFSCSGAITPDLFQKIVAGAALDARREAAIVERLAQAPDHPVRLSFPEGDYLKGLVVRVE